MLTHILPLLFLTSCAALFVSETKDADKKIEQAIRLMNENRRPMAKKLVEDALVLYQKDDNQEGMAKAYLNLGEIYKDGVTKDFQKVGESYEKAAEIDHSLKLHLSESLIYWTAGFWYGEANKKDEACSSLSKAKQAFSLKAKAKDRDKYAGIDDFPSRISQMQKKFSCK